jgi:hypothetical protein
VTKHANVKGQSICETTFFVESAVDTTRAAFFDTECPKCLRQALRAAEARTHVLRELLSKAEAVHGSQRCRIYNTVCINPTYCDARDACCAGDPDCKPEGPP